VTAEQPTRAEKNRIERVAGLMNRLREERRSFNRRTYPEVAEALDCALSEVAAEFTDMLFHRGRHGDPE
jgi:hypothetical protein